MSGLIPFSLRNNSMTRAGAFGDFYSMIDDFFSDGMMPGRNMLRDTFKIDVAEKENEYVIEAELPGVSREEIELNADRENLSISVERSEEAKKAEDNYVHKERRFTSMNRVIRLSGVRMDEITAKLENGVLSVCVPKDIEKKNPKKIEIA